MQVNNTYFQPLTAAKQNTIGYSAKTDVFSMLPQYQTVPLNASKAYASPQVNQGYKEIETFDVPNVGKGHLYELANGHKVILIHKLGPTAINTTVGVGRANNLQNKTGALHLLEHLLANAAITPPSKEIKDIMSGSGAICNAETGFLDTKYYEKVPVTNAKELENLVKVHYTILTNNNFSKEQVDKEKEIIKQEQIYSFSDKDTDNALIDAKSIQNLLNTKPIKVLDDGSQLKNITKEDLQTLYNNYYVPSNMVTTIVGNVDENSIKLVAKYLGKMPQKELKPPQFEYHPIQKTVRHDYDSISNNLDKEKIELAFDVPSNSPKDKLITEILINSNNLHQLGAYKLPAGNAEHELFYLEGKGSIGNTEENLKTAYSIIDDLSKRPITDVKLDEIKTKLKEEEACSCEDSIYLADSYSENELHDGSIKRSSEYSKILDSITVQDLSNFAKKYLDLNKVSIVVIHPNKQAENKKLSFLGNEKLLDTKDIKEYELPNNLRVVIDSRPGITQSSINFKLHSKDIVYSKPNVCYLLGASILGEAADNKGEALKKQGISIDCEASRQSMSIKLNGNPDKTIDMINCAKDVLLKPNFNIRTYDLLKKTIKAIEKDPFTPKTREKIEEEMTKESPECELATSYKGIQPQDIKSLYNGIVSNAQGVITITIPPEKLKTIQPEIFKSLSQVQQLQKSDCSTIFNSYKAIPIEKNKIFVKTNDDKKLEIDRNYKIIESGNINDKAGLLVLDKLLGGSEKSKLFQHIRNEDKISYQPSSTYTREDDKIARLNLSTSIDANNNSLKKVIEEYDKSTNELINTPVSEEELKGAKANLKCEILEKIETSKGRNKLLSDNYNSFYGINYQKELLDAIDRITPAQVQQLAKYYLSQPYLMSIEGNKETIEGNKQYIEKLGTVIKE